jgi:hypothetical protein
LSIDNEDTIFHIGEPTDEIVELMATIVIDDTKLIKILFALAVYITANENSYLFSTPGTDRSPRKHVISIGLISLANEISDLNSTSSATDTYKS